MPEMKNNFQKGRMNKDLDERIVPNGEYRDALNVEIATSNDSDMGAVQTLKGNTFLGQANNGVCIGSISDDKNDKLYFMVAGSSRDMIIEYNYVNETFAPVCVDNHAENGHRALNFNENFLITGINIVDDLLFWTDNNSEPKRINITRGKLGATIVAGNLSFTDHTKLMVRDVSINAQPNSYIPVVERNTAPYSWNGTTYTAPLILIQEKYLTVIKKGPSAAPALEMIDTLVGDTDGDALIGGDELSKTIANPSSLQFLNIDGKLDTDNDLLVDVGGGADFPPGSFLNIYKTDDRSVKVRVKVITITNPYPGSPAPPIPPPNSPPYNSEFLVEILSGNKEIQGELDLTIELEQQDALFQFKFPRFAYRYKYEDGEYSQFSPFTEPAFLPGKFNYLPKEGYNLGMVNRLRRLAIKDFVHERSMGDDVISIDILYKESNSPNIYSVKTVKRIDNSTPPSESVATTTTTPIWDSWNADSATTIAGSGEEVGNGWNGITKGYLPITTEMIHAVLPSNQLLRPWDNVPRKALAQEVIGNRLVYGNYLQNYDLKNIETNDSYIKVNIKARFHSDDVGNVSPEELHSGSNYKFLKYKPAKSVKTLRTYQLGVVYIDKYGRETPVFSEDKRGGDNASEASIYVNKEAANKRNQLIVKMDNNPPEWATHKKYFIKETSNEYYNLAMDRWYDAEDGNIWLSFPSAERNKVDESTYLILKKEHDNNIYVPEPARYKIIAIENEAPRFIKLTNLSLGAITDDGDILGTGASGFPFQGGFYVLIDGVTFEDLEWDTKLMSQDVSQVYFRIKATTGVSLWYKIKLVSLQASGYYKLETGKLFGGDMSFTSPDGTYQNRITNCEVQLSKKVPENRAEFEGRFFVKILKDHTLIEKLGIDLDSDLPYVATTSMQVQYIDPMAARTSDGPGGWIDNQTGAWYDTDKYLLSVDPRSYSESHSVTSQGVGDGVNYWKMASDDTSTDGSSSTSSGWFIDAVEGYRPYSGNRNGTLNNSEDNGGFGWNAVTSNGSWWNSGCWAGILENPPPKLLNVIGLNTYGETSTTYLNQSNLMSPGNIARTASNGQGGGVVTPQGIDTDNNIIHISYSGIGVDTSGGDYTDSTWASLDITFGADADKHVEDAEFMTKLTQPGTVWRWKEDPGQVLYQTIQNEDLTSTSSPYTSSEWSKHYSTELDAEKGVYLYNYAVHADFAMETHHTYFLDFDCGGKDFNIDSMDHVDFASRPIGDHTDDCPTIGSCVSTLAGCYLGAWITWSTFMECSVGLTGHTTSGANDWSVVGNWGDDHFIFPTGVHDWQDQKNKRRRFVIKAQVLQQEASDADPTTGEPLGIGKKGPHYYLPTNDPGLPSHFDRTATAITEFPTGHAQATNTFESLGDAGKAPGIRNDGMYSSHALPGGGAFQWDPDGTGVLENYTEIPYYKRWDGSSTPIESAIPGSVTWEIMEQFDEDEGKFTSTNPAIWETEPKEDVGLDIYHEVGQIYPIYLDSETIEQFVGAINVDANKNSFVQCWDSVAGMNTLSTTSLLPTQSFTNEDIRVIAAKDNYVMLGDPKGTAPNNTTYQGLTTGDIIPLDNNGMGHQTPNVGSYLMFWRADGSETEAFVGPNTHQDPNIAGTWYELVGENGHVHNREVRLPWFNCYSYGNGVESDRIRDDYNQVTIDNGPKASTTLEEPYLEERRKNGFIWSGLYNSTSGVNNTNQFIMAEKITKDINPTYGSIQKLFARDSDLVAFCEDRVLKVQANKDALYNADGNVNVIATNKVLGTDRPFSGDYGISLNPESFASDSYRSYFSDVSRGAILRLSQDGITNISDLGMHDWFADELASTGNNKIIGSFDNNKGEYNITLKSITPPPTAIEPCDTPLDPDLGSGSGSGSGTGEPSEPGAARYWCNGYWCQVCNAYCQNNNPTYVTYATMTGCQNNCSPPPETWECVNGLCIYDITGNNGNFSSHAACMQSLTPTGECGGTGHEG